MATPGIEPVSRGLNVWNWSIICSNLVTQSHYDWMQEFTTYLRPYRKILVKCTLVQEVMSSSTVTSRMVTELGISAVANQNSNLQESQSTLVRHSSKSQVRLKAERKQL